MSAPRPTSSRTASRGVSLVKRSDLASTAKPLVARYGPTFRQDSVWSVRMLSLAQLTLLGLAVLTIIFAADFSSVHRRLFPTTEDGKLVSVLPVGLPMPKETVAMWVNSSVLNILSMGFHDYDIRSEKIRGYFTSAGWNSFQRALSLPLYNMHSIKGGIETSRLIVWSAPFSAPTLLDQGLVAGRYHYRFRLEVLLFRREISAADRANVVLDVEIERVTADINPSGIAISDWQFVPKY